MRRGLSVYDDRESAEEEDPEEDEEGQMDDDGWTAVGPSSATRGHRPEDDHGMEHDWEGFDTIFPPAATNRSGFSPAPHTEQEPRWVTEAIDGARARMVQTTFSGPSTARPGVAPWENVSATGTEGTRRSDPRRNLAWGPVPHDHRVPRHIEDAWDAAHLTHDPTGRNRPTRARPPFRSTIEYESTHSPIREDEPRLLVSNNDMSVKLFAIRNAGATQTDPPLRWGEIQNKGPRKKLANIGGTKFDTAVNHGELRRGRLAASSVLIKAIHLPQPRSRQMVRPCSSSEIRTTSFCTTFAGAGANSARSRGTRARAMLGSRRRGARMEGSLW